MIELLPPPLKRAFFIPERNYAMALFRVRDLGIAKYGPVFRRVQTGLENIVAEHPNFHIQLAGDAVWRWRNLYQIVVDLALSLGTAIAIIFLVLSIVYRSLRIGLISLVPNIFPLAATGALLVFSGQSLELVSVCAFTICLGIAVDDTIHFLTRFNEERKKTDDLTEAIRRSFVAVGTALIITTIVLVAGFVTALTSDTRDHQIFAMMGILTIAAALFADLIFLPAMLTTFKRRNR
ncbi:MAG: efflux RND transporter permease subunit [Pirellulaceae bacterium]